MTAAIRDLPFPLLLLCLYLMSSCSPLPTPSRVPGTKPQILRPRGSLPGDLFSSTEDYDQPEDTVTPFSNATVSPHGRTLQRCDYNRCLEGQRSCASLAASTGCLCPGLSLHDVKPRTPYNTSVSWNGSEVIVHWCAPLSHVTAYVVTVGNQERRRFGRDQRSGGVGDVEDSAEVCVFAVNDSGDSDGSCMTYHPRKSSLPLTAGLIGGALGFLLLLLLVVLLWRHKRQRKQEASISTNETL
ncbi:hypothetical protein JOB18_048699 [Solea senegalensis]|nr:LRRN4 C-terminal-like protein [Solea senegalensis]KAG7517078.1 hypothetical protein JOB18_048699 [Solea senegalensis]